MVSVQLVEISGYAKTVFLPSSKQFVLFSMVINESFQLLQWKFVFYFLFHAKYFSVVQFSFLHSGLGLIKMYI